MGGLISLIIFFVIGALLLRISWSIWKIGFMLLMVAILLLLCSSFAEAHEYQPADVVLIGKVVNHEAPNESDLGKRLVVDTILNRVESDKFPNTVFDVIHQPGQYCIPDELPPKEIYTLIAEEMYNRTNNSVLWYRTKKYHTYGVPIIKEGNHYFSGR